MSSSVPIPEPEEIQICPYDPAHAVRSKRLVYHLEKCRKGFVGQKKTCPFNSKHRVPAPELHYHMSSCPDKAILDQDLRYSVMKQSGLIDDSPCGDLNIPDDNFNIPSEENWESEINVNQSYFRLGQKRIDNSNTLGCLDEQLRPPITSTGPPVYRFSAMELPSAGLGRGRGMGRGIAQANNSPSRTEGHKNRQQVNVPLGRGFSKIAEAQQWQKSDSTIESVNSDCAENTFSLGIGRGIKKKNIESNCGNNKAASKTVVTLEDLQKQSRRIEKKLRQISKLKEMKVQGTTLAKDEEMKLEKKEILEEELEQVTSKIKRWKIK